MSNCPKRVATTPSIFMKPMKAVKPEECASSCKKCNSHHSSCSCNFKAPVRKTTPLNSNCILVNSIVGSKMVQKVAELTLPITVFAGLGLLSNIVSIQVVPNLAGITQNGRIITDKVVNIGLVPATITITILGVALPVVLTTSLPFQQHTDFPGACPQDLLLETPLEVEGIFTQPGVPVVGITGVTLVEGILFKIVLRTTITVTRQVIADEHGNICDLNNGRCEPFTAPPVFNLPGPPSTGILPG